VVLPANTGVDLFFVISGLIMTVTTWHTFDQAGASGRFLWRRLTRIYPLYWAINTPIVLMILLAPGVVDWQGERSDLARSFLLLPTDDRLPVLVAWSLVFEMYFYTLFTLALLIGRRWFGVVVGAWAIATVALAVLVGATSNPFLAIASDPMVLEFVLGIVIGYALVRGWLYRPWVALAVAVVALGAVWGYLAGSGLDEFPSEAWRLLGPGVAMALVVYAAVDLELRARRVAFRGLQRLGDASYSLYLTHVPALTLLLLAVQHTLPSTDVVHLVMLAFIPVYVVVVAGLTYLLVERPLLSLFRSATKVLSRGARRRARPEPA
jgi:peptidoglycan/LPS O-acetylase OafA/YrhL